MLPTPGTFSVLPRWLSRWCKLTGIALGIILPATGANADPTDPWQSALNLDYNTASDGLARQHDVAPDDLRITCAYAASLLVREPVTDANVEKARSLLESVIANAPRTDVQHRPLALYLTARIDHDHINPPRLDEAQVRYEQLRREYPTHPLADQSAVHLGLLQAVQSPPPDPKPAVAIVEALLAQVSTPASRRELHHLIAYLHWQVRHDAAAALPHYIAGREIGFETPYRNSELDLTIAGLAAETGQNELAAQYYLKFAETNPRDGRAQSARRLAAEAFARTQPRP